MTFPLLGKVPRAFWLALVTLAAIVGFSFASKRLYGDRTRNGALVRKGADMMKHAADWTFSAQQSNDPVLALNHAAYAKAYMNVARNMASDADLTRFSAVPVEDLRQDVELQEEKARKRLSKLLQRKGGMTVPGNRWAAIERAVAAQQDQQLANTEQFQFPGTQYQLRPQQGFTQL